MCHIYLKLFKGGFFRNLLMSNCLYIQVSASSQFPLMITASCVTREITIFHDLKNILEKNNSKCNVINYLHDFQDHQILKQNNLIINNNQYFQILKERENT